MSESLLFLCPRVPWPLNTGAKIRTGALLRALAREFEVDYAGFLAPDLPESEARARLAEAGCREVTLVPEAATGMAGKVALGLRNLMSALPMTVAKYQDGRLSDYVDQWAAEHPGGIVHADHVHMAFYLLCDMAVGCLRVMDEHNVEAQILERMAERFSPAGVARLAAGPARVWLRAQAGRMARLEGHLVAKADRVLAVSEEDARRLSEMGGGKDVQVVRNGVDIEFFRQAPEETARRPGRLIFTGSMNWAPNQDAVIHFCEEVLPVLDRRHADGGPWSLDIVGHAPPPAVRALAGARVRVTGTVDDVRPYVDEASVFVVPLRIGGGSRLKILEAFAMGIPVVSTGTGCEGLNVTDGEQLLVADGAEAFAEAVARVAGDEAMARELRERARTHVLKHFTWERIGGELAASYRRREARSIGG